MSNKSQRGTGTFHALFALSLIALAATPAAQAQCTGPQDCGDGLFCTDDICFIPGPTGQCLNPNRTCADGSYCNGSEICNESRDVCEFACLGGTVCTSGFCACSVPGTCPNGNEGAACDISVQPVVCDPGEVCNDVLDQCAECSQNSHCTSQPEDRCNTATGECVECLNDFDCQDGLFCNGSETCNLSTGFCTPGTTVQCDFGEFCSELLDRCVECESDSQCDDGLYCNGGETCVNDTCQAGTPVNCAVLNPATPHCNEVADNCVRCLNDFHCNDGLLCTSDACVFNNCSNTPDPGQFCDDGDFCNGAEQCNVNNTGCVPGTPPSCPKTCFRGPTAGAVCTTDAQCGKACLEGSRQGLTCGVDNDCGKTCAGGSNNGTACTADDECDSGNCTSKGLCATGLCRGGCSELHNQCVQCASDVVGSTSCSDNLLCDGVETCDGAHQCVSPPRETCSSFNAECTKGVCNDTTGCSSTPRANGTACDDLNACTRVDECLNGACVEDVVVNDPFRCIRLALVPEVPGNLGIGSTARIRLMAYAEGCNVASDGICPSNSPPIVGIEAFLSWDPAKLELQPSVLGDFNPEDPCNSATTCFVCPPNQYDWKNEKPWPNDCATAENPLNDPCVCDGGLNNGQPCSSHEFCDTNPDPQINYFCNVAGGFAGTPANDGDAAYFALSQLGTCGGVPNPACIPPTGLHVTTFKFKALPAGLNSSASVTFLTCSGNQQRQTQIVGYGDPPPNYSSTDMTKVLASNANYNIVSCTSSTACNDGNPCTMDNCNNGSCFNTQRDCTSPDPCAIGSCDATTGNCIATPIPCDEGERCYGGECFETCTVPADCDDAVGCTIDTCDNVDAGADICRHQADDSACDTGLFCAAQRCDLVADCVFDHSCYSTTGNPCRDNQTCDENSDTCGGCLSPQVQAVGGRYLRITAPAQGGTPVALLVEGDCFSAEVSCVSRYVQSRCVGGPDDNQVCANQADCQMVCLGGPTPGMTCTTTLNCGVGGTCVGACIKGGLGDEPVFLTAADWGSVSVTGLEIRPRTLYRSLAECDFGGSSVLSAASTATAWVWGDVSGDGQANVIDVGTVVNAVKGLYGPTVVFEATNVAPCATDGSVNVIDIGTVVDVVKGSIFNCQTACP